MIVLSHRGYWLEASEKNQKISFDRSFDFNFGTETDIRDFNGKLVISHDMPNGKEMDFTEFTQIVGDRNLPLALNIKADGLVDSLIHIMQATNLTNWFVFDMAVPDMRSYLQAGVPVYTRMSEVERSPAWLDQATGVWLDAFHDVWYDADHVKELLDSGKKVCIVSCELHGRNPDSLWNMIVPISNHPALMLCTDYPEKARAFFGGAQ